LLPVLSSSEALLSKDFTKSAGGLHQRTKSKQQMFGQQARNKVHVVGIMAVCHVQPAGACDFGTAELPNSLGNLGRMYSDGKHRW